MNYRTKAEVEKDIDIISYSSNTEPGVLEIISECIIKLTMLILMLILAMLFIALIGACIICVCWFIGFIFSFIAKYNLVIAIILPVIVVLFSFYYSYKKKKERNKHLSFCDTIDRVF